MDSSKNTAGLNSDNVIFNEWKTAESDNFIWILQKRISEQCNDAVPPVIPFFRICCVIESKDGSNNFSAIKAKIADIPIKIRTIKIVSKIFMIKS